MNALTKSSPPHVTSVVPAQRNTLLPNNMNEALQLAEWMARAKGLPPHFHNSPGDCLMVIELAMRWRMSPFAVAQCTSNIKGKQMQEGKIVAAAIESSGAIDGYMDYAFSGDGQMRKVVVTARRFGDAEPRSVEVVLKDVATDNIWWKKTPDQMLTYHGARVWARRWTPGVVAGVYSPEEMNSRDPAPYEGTTIDARPEMPAPNTGEIINDSIPDFDAPGYPFVGKGGTKMYRDPAAYVAAWKRGIDACTANQELDKLQDARDANAMQIREIADHDAATAAKVGHMLDVALGEVIEPEVDAA